MGGVTPEERATRRARRAARAAREAAAPTATAAPSPVDTAEREARRARRAARDAREASAAKPAAAAKERLPIETLYQDDDFAVSRMGDPDARRVVLCFAGIGAGKMGQGKFAMALGGMQPAEFVGSSRLEDSVVLHIADIRRSWFNGFPHHRLLGVLHPLVAGKPIVTMGNSMGAFGAIWISTLLPVEVAMAFAPQFSVHPEIMPREQRWRDWTSLIADWKVPSLADCFVPATRYYTFNGDRDRLHWRAFPKLPNAHHYLIDGAGHKAAAKIKEAGALEPVINACLADGDPRAVMTSAGLTVTEIAA